MHFHVITHRLKDIVLALTEYTFVRLVVVDDRGAMLPQIIHILVIHVTVLAGIHRRDQMLTDDGLAAVFPFIAINMFLEKRKEGN